MARLGAPSCTIFGTEFGVLGTLLNIRQLKYLIPDSPVHQKTRFHVPGTDGNVVVYHGRVARKINAHLLYIGPLQDIMEAYETDVLAWCNLPGEIVDAYGNTFSRCNLESMTRTEPTGCDGDEAFFFSNAVFSSDD